MALRISVTAPGVTCKLAVAELAQHVLAGMRHRVEARQAEKAAGALDGVHQAEDVAENGGVGGSRSNRTSSTVERGEAFVGFGQEFLQQIVHETGLRTHGRTTS